MGAATFFVCAIFSATAFGGRPGPPGRHFPRALRRRRRPFFSLVFPVEMLPSNDWIAEPTSCCTMSRITVTQLFRRGIDPPSTDGIRLCENSSGVAICEYQPEPLEGNGRARHVGPSQRGRLAAPVRERRAFSSGLVTATQADTAWRIVQNP